MILWEKWIFSYRIFVGIVFGQIVLYFEKYYTVIKSQIKDLIDVNTTTTSRVNNASTQTSNKIGMR